MAVIVPVEAIQLHPGSAICIPGLSWQDFEAILGELGEQRRVRVAYYQGTLEIMSPLALHERPHRIIADIVKAILTSQGKDWEDFGSTTLKQMGVAGVEPDTCLYIENADKVRGCTRLDLSVYPPPDLAIESDVTSQTTLAAYTAVAVPEVWIYSEGELLIYRFQGGGYQEVEVSGLFPCLPLKGLIPQWVKQGMERGTSQMLRKVRDSFL
jgi:Uma2 family endonuclease